VILNDAAPNYVKNVPAYCCGDDIASFSKHHGISAKKRSKTTSEVAADAATFSSRV